MKDELQLRLESFEIDQPGARFPFSARLARENGWSRSFARRVVVEYKRFVWLAMRAGHPVTPSEEVDEAWHLHLCYTRSYWDKMCGEILGKPLHHGPTEGGRAEDEKFAGWYERTLESYRIHFGEAPPADIWPLVKERFRPNETRKVDARRHWIVPKRVVRRGSSGAAVIAGASALVGCTGVLAIADTGLVIALLLLLCLVILLVVVVTKAARSNGKKDDGCGSSGCGSSGCGSSSSSQSSSDDSNSGCSSDSGGSSGCGSSGCGGGGCGGGGGY